MLQIAGYRSTIRVRNTIRYGGMFNFSFWGMNVQFYGISPDYSLHNSIIFGKKKTLFLIYRKGTRPGRVQLIKNAYHFHLTGKRLKISKNCFCLYYICNIYYDFLFTFNENCFGVIPK